MSLISTSYPYKEDGILPDGSKVPDIPIVSLLIVRKGLRRGLVGDAIVDTGFDGAIYANLDLVEFLEGSRPTRSASLKAAGHSIACEVFDVECHIADESSKPVLPLGMVEAYVPIDPADVSEDVIVGRAIVNRVRIELDGKVAKFFPLR